MQTLSEQLAGLANWLDAVAAEYHDAEISMRAMWVRGQALRLAGRVVVPVNISQGDTGRWCARINAGVTRRYGDTATEAFANLQAALMGEDEWQISPGHQKPAKP